MGRLGMNILEGKLFILCVVAVECGYILYSMNGYITVMDYTIVVSIHHIIFYLTNDIIVAISKSGPTSAWSIFIYIYIYIYIYVLLLYLW